MEPEQINPTSELAPTESSIIKSKTHLYAIFCILLFSLVYVFSSIYIANNKEPAFAPHFDKERNCYRSAIDLCSSVVDETSNWKTYRNEEYGFEFKYPQDWKIDDEGIDFSHVITISHNDAVEIIKNGQNLGPDGAISFSVYDDQGLDISKFVVDFLDLYLFSKKDTIIDGITSVEAINGSGSGFPGKHVYIPNNNKVFMVGGGADNMREDVFYKILSTLKFNGITDISTWETYRNEEYGFEFKYPVDWEVSTSTQTVIINSKTNAKKIADFEMRNMDTDAGPRDDIAVLLPTDRIIMNLEEYISYEKRKEFFLDTRPITVGGLSGYEFTEIGFSGVYTILLNSKKNFYEIIFGYRGSREELSSIENKILSTFKFIDKTDISTWKSYRNEVYGFEFKYPSDSYVESSNGNIRIQNYNGYRQGLASGEFWLDFNEKPGKGSCQSEATNLNKKQDDLGTYYIGPLPFTEMNESGGERFVLCADKSGNSIFIQAFENNINGPLVNQILSTFRFTK